LIPGRHTVFPAIPASGIADHPKYWVNSAAIGVIFAHGRFGPAPARKSNRIKLLLKARLLWQLPEWTQPGEIGVDAAWT
jgi:hypothetical protein